MSDERGEFDFINLIRRRALRRRQGFNSSLLYGIGDDAAVFRQRRGLQSVVTVDLLVEEIDFRLSTTTPRALGHKALAVSLSDVAAMGARPRFALLSLGLPREVWRSKFLEDFYEGFFALADRYQVALAGGDISRTPERIVIDSVVIGEVEEGRALFRSGARRGEHIFVTGSLGGSAMGLHLLERGRIRRSIDEREAVERHRRPEPRVAWGALLGEERLATAMIDISDGLSSDLSHLCRASRAGAVIDSRRIPFDASALALCKELRLDPLALALNGGEDFELLFTVAPRDIVRLPKSVQGVPATYIGDVTVEQDGISLREGRKLSPLRPRGFAHFKR
jgi:thiamine-monophosphate kinase